MGAITAPQGTRAAFTITLTSLASATYVASSAVNLESADALDVLIEVAITPGTTSGNKQAKVFCQVTIDAADSNWTTGPTSGTTTDDEANLYFLGVLPLVTASTLQRRVWSLMDAIGFVPNRLKLVVLNDSGASFAASNCSASYATVTGNAA